jgi:hypothetical protein
MTRKLPLKLNKLRIDNSISFSERDEEVKIYGMPNSWNIRFEEGGLPVAEICRKHGTSNVTY